MALITDVHSWEYVQEFDGAPNEKWFGVAFNYTVDVDEKPWNEISEWCIDMFGYPQKMDVVDEAIWTDGLRFGEIAFKDERHVSFFILRWA